MRKKYTLFLFSIFLVKLNLFAQNEFIVDFNDLEVKPLTVKNFTIGSVVDLRWNKSNIGFIYSGLGNKMKQAVLDGTFDSTLFALSMKVVNYSCVECDKVILAIDRFEISETITATTEFAFVNINYSFWKKGDDGLFYTLLEGDKQIKQGGLDVTLGHPKRIARALEEIYFTLDSTLSISKNITINQKGLKNIGKEYIADTSTFIYKSIVTPRKGIYKNFYEFIYNSPSIEDLDFYTMVFSNSSKIAELKKVSNEAKIKNKFAYYDGIDFYICRCSYQVYTGAEINQYIKVSEFGRYLFIRDEMGNTEFNSGAIYAAMMFGVVGVLAYSAISEAGNDEPITTSYQYGLIFDVKNGVFIQATKKNMLNLLHIYPELAMKYKNMKEINYDINHAFVKSLNNRLAKK